MALQWRLIKTFESGDLCVEVSESNTFVPMYTARVGRRKDTGAIGPFLPLRVSGQGKLVVEDVSAVVADLLKQAQDFVLQEMQRREDARIARLIEREERAVKREGKKQRPSGYKQQPSKHAEKQA